MILLGDFTGASAQPRVAPAGFDAETIDRDARYPYVVIDQELSAALEEFGRHMGVPVRVSDQVAGRLRGPLPVSTVGEFLEELESRHGVQPYYDGAVLHFSSVEEAMSEMVRIDGVGIDRLRDELSALGLLDRRYSLRASGDAGAAVIYGPPRYREMVKTTLVALRDRPEAPAASGGGSYAVNVIRGYTAE